MTSSTGRPSNPPLALTSSRQISSAVPITLLGAAPAPVSARLNPTLMRSPLCADAPDGAKNPMINAATDARSAIPHTFPIVSSSSAASLHPPGSLVEHSRIGRYGISALFSVRLHARELDHLAPFLCLGCHIGAELRGAEHHWRHDQLGEPRLDVRVCEPGIDLTAELLNDRGRRAPWDSEPSPSERLVARSGLRNGRHVR